MSDPTPHPATFNSHISDAIIDIADFPHIAPYSPLQILDPFAGVGGIHEMWSAEDPWGDAVQTWGVELESEWADQHDRTVVGDALNLMPAMQRIYKVARHLAMTDDNVVVPRLDQSDFRWDAIITSPCYGNRMADKYAGDGTPRYTYRIKLGRELSSGSAAGLQWGTAYRVFHRRAWAEATRVCKPGSVFVLNIKDHPRKGVIQPVSQWHEGVLVGLGWEKVDEVTVESPGQRHGANKDQTVDFEWVKKYQLKEMW